MSKLKICVYAIAKNEEKFIKRFCDSAKDADLIVILDTGSTDNTVKIAKECNALVQTIPVVPWRFDTARNIALNLIPVDYDVCFAADVDEIFQPGWREQIEVHWKPNTTRMKYLFESGPGHVWYNTKIHSRFGYLWHHICHEMLFSDPRITNEWACTDKLLLVHRPDPTKSRGQYIDLLQADMDEKPNNARSLFYYSRELYYMKDYIKSIVFANKYLDIDTDTTFERNFILRMKGECLLYTDHKEDALKIFRQACQEKGDIRDSWVCLAEGCYTAGAWRESFYAATKALDINYNPHNYTCSSIVWGWKPYDLAAIAASKIDMKKQAIEYGTVALNYDPDNIRLQNNLKWYNQMKD